MGRAAPEGISCLGRGLAMIIDIINPQRIVIGSIYTRCLAFLQPAMGAEIAREALPAAARVCKVVPAAQGESMRDNACLSVAVDGFARDSPHGGRQATT